jgi:hypothetical protein
MPVISSLNGTPAAATDVAAKAPENLLPPRSGSLPMTKDDYLASDQKDPYLDFMLLGIAPKIDNPGGVLSGDLELLCKQLLWKKEFGALEFLLAGCGTLKSFLIPWKLSGQAYEKLPGILQRTQPDIELLNCVSINPETATTFSKSVVACIAVCKGLKQIEVSGLKESSARIFFEGIDSHPGIESLSVHGMSIENDEAGRQFTNALQSLPQLKALSLHFSAPASAEVAVWRTLGSPPLIDKLESLSLYPEHFSEEASTKCLGDLIAQSPALKSITIENDLNIEISPERFSANIASGISRSQSLQSVVVQGGTWLGDGLPSIIESLKNCPAPLTHLFLKINDPHRLPITAVESLVELVRRCPDAAFRANENLMRQDWLEERMWEFEPPVINADYAQPSDPQASARNRERFRKAVRQIFDMHDVQRALANGSLVESHSQAFVHPDGWPQGPENLVSDASKVLAKQILRHSGSVQEFEQVMANVAYTVTALGTPATTASNPSSQPDQQSTATPAEANSPTAVKVSTAKPLEQSN